MVNIQLMSTKLWKLLKQCSTFWSSNKYSKQKSRHTEASGNIDTKSRSVRPDYTQLSCSFFPFFYVSSDHYLCNSCFRKTSMLLNGKNRILKELTRCITLLWFILGLSPWSHAPHTSRLHPGSPHLTFARKPGYHCDDVFFPVSIC